MPIQTRLQIKNSVLDSTQQLSAQIGSLVNDFINITLQEIASPAWAFDNQYQHLWSWLKRKTTFSTVASTEDYVLERDVDKIAVLRQTASPAKLTQIPDHLFYKHIPNPTQTGNPRFYRMWGIDGVSTKLAAADTIDVLSSSASDGSTFTVIVSGYVSGRLQTNSYSLNGTTAVAGTTTFDAREIFVSKSGNTTGNITVRRNSTSATLVVLAPQETTPRFKILSLYPIPSSAITMYLEYYKRIRELTSDTDVPEFDSKWHHVVRFGTLSKVNQYLGKTDDFITTQKLYEKLVRAMVADDKVKPDLIETMERRKTRDFADIILQRSEDVVA